jgi:hypothetical protein
MSAKKPSIAKIKDHEKNGIMFSADYMIEIFNAPLMGDDSNGTEVETAWDLCRMSVHEGFDELFLPYSDVVRGESNGEQLQFARDDFIKWQLERFNAETLYHLAAKTDASIAGSCNTDFQPVDKLLNFEEEYEKDPQFDPDTWLNENILDNENKKKGLMLIERVRKEKPREFYKLLIDGIVDENTGLLTWLETEIDDNLAEVRDSYAHWSAPLIVVSEGDFAPYINPENMSNLMMDDMRLNRMYVRNYDEDEKI